MKHMRKIIGVLAVLLICTAFVGAGAAFTYSSDAVVTPAGSLTPGQKVTATMKIVVTGGSVDASDKITLSTPLTSAQWTTVIYKGGQAVSAEGKHSSTIYGFDLDYGDKTDVTLQITLTGVVPSSQKGKQISVMSISATSKELNGYTSYSSKKQMVYDPNNLNSDIAASEKAAATLEERAATYAGYGIDTTSVVSSIGQAKTKTAAAKSVGSSSITTAYANIEAADTILTKAERDLDYAGLKAANTNIGKINSIASTLYSKNWDSEAQYLETKSMNMENSYNSLYATYKSGGVPDAKKTDALVADSFNTLERANEYLEDSKVPFIVKLLPFIGGGIVIAGAVVGIVFLIRRRRANSWDELG
ncbi:MAG TPA: hypothetical protein O0X09_04875 [Methanocorpusculum sp.]|nr:hypothetical protein [Methanocorpusculum sp.]